MHILFVDVAMKTDSTSMTDVESMVTNFATSARAGRRNALPDIQSSAATAGSSELPLKLADLSVKEGNNSKSSENDQCFSLLNQSFSLKWFFF